MSRLTFLIIAFTLTFTGVILASGVRSQNLKTVKVTLEIKGSLKTVLGELEKRSGFGFVYAEEAGNITGIRLSGETLSLDVILKEIARQKALKFEQNGSLIIVTQAPPPAEPGKIYGKIVDDKGQSLPGANIRIVELNLAVAGTVDGSYSISAAPGTYTVEVSYISYQTKRIADVVVKSDNLTKLDVVLLPASNSLEAVVIQSSYKKESAAGLYAQQKNAASVTDGISAEQIARTPDNNMGQALKRVSGVVTLDNRYVVVRGMGDRYNQGMIDGITLPSTDMNRHNFAFDAIPVEMVSNVVVNKTATPDVSGEFAGGQVSVNTLDIPLENFTILSAGAGFNSNTIGKDFVQAGQRGKYDFFGFDDGHRKLPAGIQSWTSATPPDYATAQSKLFSPDAFRTYTYQGSPNQNYRLALGRVYELQHDQKIGFVAGLSLRNNQDTYNYENARPFPANIQYVQDGQFGNTAYIDSAKIRRQGHIYKYSSTAGAQLNIGLQGKAYKIGFKNIFSQVFSNPFNTYTGANKEDYFTARPTREQSNLQDPEFTRILQNKLDGEIGLTKSGLKLSWLAARTSVSQETRDRSKFTYMLTGIKDGVEYFQTPQVANPNIVNPVYDYRIFTDTKQTDYNWALNLSLPFTFLGDKSLVKAGYNGTRKHRALDATTLNIRTEDRSYDAFNKTYDVILAPENMGTGTGQVYYAANALSGTQFDGSSTFNAGYLMLDQRFLQKIRLVYGLRLEKYDLQNKQPQISDQNTTVRKVTGENNVNYLPSVNATFSITPKMNFRASFAKTIIRPDFRETSYFGFYDADLDALIVGGDLVSTKISNTDLRYEWYPSAGEIISVSGFYKSFDKPIELVVDRDVAGGPSQFRYQNQKSAVNYGLELELRKTLGFIADKQWLRNLSLFGNGSVIRSKVHTLFYEGTIGVNSVPRENDETRALFGQSPYVVNGGIGYAAPRYGMTLSYNRFGRRTYVIDRDPARTEYENGRDQVDLQLYGRLLKQKIEVKLNIGNLLNSQAIYYTNSNGYKGVGTQSLPDFHYEKVKGTDSYEKEYDDVRYRIKYGTTANLSISYKF